MNELDEIKIVFSKNLKMQLAKHNKSQVDLTNYMNVSGSTVSDWCNGKKMPRMDKIQHICDWLRIGRDDLLSDNNDMDISLLSPAAMQLVESFNQLNEEGQNKLLDYADDLLQSKKYKAHDTAGMVAGQ